MKKTYLYGFQGCASYESWKNWVALGYYGIVLNEFHKMVLQEPLFIIELENALNTTSQEYLKFACLCRLNAEIHNRNFESAE